MIKLIFALVLFLTTFLLMGQEVQKKPKYPKGSDATQMKALPFYNEAVELYKKGKTEAAIKSLEEAINTSFALVEAQMFLADIYYEKGAYQKALLYYHSGLDFIPEQEPHYYFRLFELSMRYGEYDVLKHNLKAFYKLYKNKVSGKYEDDYPYTKDDYEYYERCKDFVFHYTTWQGPFLVQFDHQVKGYEVKGRFKNQLIINENNHFFTLDPSLKKEKLTGFEFTPQEVEFIHLCDNKRLAFVSKKNKGKTTIDYTVFNNGTWTPLKTLDASINKGSWQGTPYFLERENLLYFSSDVNGNKDLFVAKLNRNEEKIDYVEALDRINTEKDEIYPYFVEGTRVFYFSSNGIKGLGGFDVFHCIDHQMEDNKIQHFNPLNSKAPINSNDDDFSYSFENGVPNFILRNTIEGTIIISFLKPKEWAKGSMDFELPYVDPKSFDNE